VKLKPPHDRKTFLLALIAYAQDSSTHNPVFSRGEILNRLSIDEKTFTNLQRSLGPQYCERVDRQNAEPRYMINLAACLTLQERFANEEVQTRRHIETRWLIIVTALVGAAVTVFTAWFFE
jgi:hypothetical protein